MKRTRWKPTAMAIVLGMITAATAMAVDLELLVRSPMGGR